MTAPAIVLTIPFPGFYDSALSHELNQAEEMFIDQLIGQGEYGGIVNPEFPDVSEGDAAEAVFNSVDYRAAHREIAEEYAGQFAHALNANLPGGVAPFALTYEGMDSPREYNFAADRCYMRLPLADFARMRAALDPAIWEETLAEMFTSYDGFHSHYSPDPARWVTKPLDEYDHNEAGAVLRAYIQTHWDDFDEMELIERMAGNGVFLYALDDAVDFDKLRGLLAKKGR